MHTSSRALLRFVAAAPFALCAADAVAAAPRTFVASTGSDANACSLAQPCRTFGSAILNTMPGGEIVALDSAGYGAIIITKAVTVAGPPGVQASITAASGYAVTVNAGTSDRVVLRGLDIITTGSASNGISILSAGEVVIEDCDISGVASYGVGATGPGLLTISRARIDAGINQTALGVFGSAGELRFVLEDSRLHASGSGVAIIAVGKITGIVRNSALLGTSSFATYGVRAEGSAGKTTSIALQKSLVSGFVYGVWADGQGVSLSANVSIGDSDIAGNQFGLWAVAGGTIALSASRITQNSFGATGDANSYVFTDGRNFFGYNTNDLNLSTTLVGPLGIR